MQFHPEAAAGPHDAGYLFDRFVGLMAEDTGKVGRTVPDPQFGNTPRKVPA